MNYSISYCVKCKKKTHTLNGQIRQTKNSKNIYVGKCRICGNTKSLFVGQNLLGQNLFGHGMLNSALNSGQLPEMHLPKYNFCGPGTKLRQRLLRGDAPINELDMHCRDHDMHYAIFKDTKDRHVFDEKLQKKAFEIAKSSKNLGTKFQAGLVGSTMYAKRKLGLGT